MISVNMPSNIKG